MKFLLKKKKNKYNIKYDFLWRSFSFGNQFMSGIENEWKHIRHANK